MIINSTIDLIIGSIPLLGTIFDIFYKANNRNVRLLKEHYHEGKHTGSGKGLIILTIIVVMLIIIGLAVLLWWLVSSLFALF